jgi:hypothetical protein
MLLTAKGTCAACHGVIQGIVNTLMWYGTDIDLCTPCMQLGDGSPKDDATLVALVSQRANPKAPVNDLEGAVREWIAVRDHEGARAAPKSLAEVLDEVAKPDDE